MRKTCFALFVCSLVLFQMGIGGAVQAASISVSDSITPATMTDWSQFLTVNKFNIPSTVLQSVDIMLTGHLAGAMRMENMAPSSSTITMKLSAVVDLKRPDNSSLLTAIPSVLRTDLVSGYDGAFDWGGSSGRSYLDLTADKTESLNNITAPADLALFTGAGTISLPVTAMGNSTATGSGNLITWFTTLAAADVRVTYNYITIPEPGSLLALATGLFGLVGLGMRRRR